MRLLSRALRAAHGCRAAALSARSYRAAPAGGSAAAGPCQPQPRRSLSGRPCLDGLFATGALSRLLEARASGEAGPALAARIQRLRDKEQELRDTRQLAGQGEPRRRDWSPAARPRPAPEAAAGGGRWEGAGRWASCASGG